MKYFVVFLVLASFAVIISQSFGECISLPCDDANIKLDEPNYRFIDFSYANSFEDSITFILERPHMGIVPHLMLKLLMRRVILYGVKDLMHCVIQSKILL